MNSTDKRNSVRRDYDLIAEQYGEEFGSYIEDLDIYDEFEKYLPDGGNILDLGCGTGRTYAHFSKKGYQYVGLDFSEKMKEKAFELHGKFPYIVDDIMNVKEYFGSESFDAIFAVYSLFHLPKEDFEQTIANIHDLLKVGGVVLLSYQRGEGEKFVDEPYLKDEGREILYMNYMEKLYVNQLLEKTGFEKVFEAEKHEEGSGVIGDGGNDAVYLIARKGK